MIAAVGMQRFVGDMPEAFHVAGGKKTSGTGLSTASSRQDQSSIRRSDVMLNFAVTITSGITTSRPLASLESLESIVVPHVQNELHFCERMLRFSKF